MADNHLQLFCVVEGERQSSMFFVKPTLTDTVGDLKDLILTKKSPGFDDIVADELTLWRVSIPIDPANKNRVVDLKAYEAATRLEWSDCVSGVFPPPEEVPKETILIIVQRPPPVPSPPVSEHISHKRPRVDVLDLQHNKKIRIIEEWRQYTASDGKVVDLPPPWIDMLACTKFVPEPRAAFGHLNSSFQAGDAVIVPCLGQIPKLFGLFGQNRKLFVTEQMLELWEDMRGDQESTYRRVLSGPMGVGKSYLSYFLAAKAYAEGWLILYVSDAGGLVYCYEDRSAQELVERFLALNKDILTGAELEMLVNDYDGTRNIYSNVLSVIFDALLKSKDRKTLLLVDEHRQLFMREPSLPDRFKSLVPLSSYDWWGEDAKGSRLIFSGTRHANYEMTIMDMCHRLWYVVNVGPLSRHVFSRLLDTYPRLAAPAIREEVIAITNCVPGELKSLLYDFKQLPDPISLNNLNNWTKNRGMELSRIPWWYVKKCEQQSKEKLEKLHKTLLYTFLGRSSAFDFDWGFVDLGLVYRSKDVPQMETRLHILCRPVQEALLAEFRELPLPEDTKRQLCDGSLSEDHFETALYHQLICATKPIVLNATDLNNNNATIVSLDFSHCETLRAGKASLGPGNENVLTRGYKGYHRFDFMLGRLFFQTSTSDFEQHNTGSAEVSKAFNVRDDHGANQIERYLDDMFGSGHSAKIENNRFVVTKNGVPVPDFHVVYLRGSPGKPAHREWVNKHPDLLHVSFEELKEKLFKYLY